MHVMAALFAEYAEFPTTLFSASFLLPGIFHYCHYCYYYYYYHYQLFQIPIRSDAGQWSLLGKYHFIISFILINIIIRFTKFVRHTKKDESMLLHF